MGIARGATIANDQAGSSATRTKQNDSDKCPIRELIETNLLLVTLLCRDVREEGDFCDFEGDASGSAEIVEKTFSDSERFTDLMNLVRGYIIF